MTDKEETSIKSVLSGSKVGMTSGQNSNSPKFGGGKGELFLFELIRRNFKVVNIPENQFLGSAKRRNIWRFPYFTMKKYGSSPILLLNCARKMKFDIHI